MAETNGLRSYDCGPIDTMVNLKELRDELADWLILIDQNNGQINGQINGQ